MAGDEMASAKRIRRTMLAAVMALAAGCGSNVPTSKVEAFIRDQADIVTPHGTIDRESVTEGPDGTIVYQTEDGSRWQTDQVGDPSGEYDWARPRRIHEQDDE